VDGKWKSGESMKQEVSSLDIISANTIAQPHFYSKALRNGWWKQVVGNRKPLSMCSGLGVIMDIDIRYSIDAFFAIILIWFYFYFFTMIRAIMDFNDEILAMVSTQKKNDEGLDYNLDHEEDWQLWNSKAEIFGDLFLVWLPFNH
jgi:hypothetical protein